MVPLRPFALVVSSGAAVFLSVPSPVSCETGSSSRELYASPECCRSVSGPLSSCDDAESRPSWGLAFPLRGTSVARLLDGIPLPPKLRPDVLHVLDDTARPTLRVYFTPLPRPGFTLQGFCPSHSRSGSSPNRALSSLAQNAADSCPPAPHPFASPSGLSLRVRTRFHRDGV